MKNWWYYHKWYVISFLTIGGIAIYLFLRSLGIGQVEPDLQIAYVGDTALPEDVLPVVEQIFAIFTEDFNGDGEINVQLRQYVSVANSTDADAAYYGYGSEVSLLGDINDCDSYIFLMDDPEKFQRDFHVLAKPDGSCPEELDFSVEDKVFLWKNCPVLSSFDLGTSTSTIFGQSITTDMQKILGELYIGRRCFYTETTCAHLTSCSELFERIREGIK